MLDEKTKEAIKFIETIYDFSINAKKTDFVNKVFNLLCSNKKYTPYAKVFLSPQLINDILNAEDVFINQQIEPMGMEELSELFEVDSDYETMLDEDIVKRTWKKIYKKYSEKDIGSITLDGKFICEVIDTEEDAIIEQLEEKYPPNEPPSSGNYTKIHERSEKVLAVEDDLLKEAENLFELNKDAEAMTKIEEALALSKNRDLIFNLHFKVADLMVKSKNYHEAIHQMYLGISHFKSCFIYGRPVNKYGDYPLFIEMGDRVFVNIWYIFKEIKNVIARMENIPEKETTAPERQKLLDMIRFMVLTMEDWQYKMMIE